MTRRILLLGLAAALAGSCGYGFGTVGTHVPATATSIAIRPFANRTRERGLEIALQRALEEEFRRRSGLAVVDDPAGDLVLTGVLRSFLQPAVSFGTADEAVRYQGVLRVSVRLEERATKRVLFRAPLLQQTLDFAATPGVVVTSSPRFQQGTMDARDLVELTNAQLLEANRRQALGRLVDALARDVYLQAMEGF